MKKIELEIGCELPIFEAILVSPERINMLPRGYYEKFMAYMIQEEMYDHISKLESIKEKISDETLDEMLDNAELPHF